MRSVPSVGRRIAPQQRNWRTLAASAVALVFFGATIAMLSSGLGLVEAAHWAAAQQRAFYEMVQALMNHRGGVLASAGLVGACFAYGFVHAAIPGHGKFLIAGAGVASRISATRLVALALAASFAQAVTAIALVYGSFAAFAITAGWVMAASDKVLAPLSYLMILAIAVVLILRAVRGLGAFWAHQSDRLAALRSGRPAHIHHADEHGMCGCGHRHAPTLEEADAIASWRDAAMLIVSIGFRPCTGAVFVLVAAWRLNLVGAGALAAVAMAAGTGLFVSLVALSAVTARGATLFAAGARHAGFVVPVLQLVAGVAILLVSMAFLIAPVAG